MAMHNWKRGDWAVCASGLCRVEGISGHVFEISTVSIGPDGAPTWRDETILGHGDTLKPLTDPETLLAADTLDLMDIKASARRKFPELTDTQVFGCVQINGGVTHTSIRKLNLMIATKAEAMLAIREARANAAAAAKEASSAERAEPHANGQQPEFRTSDFRESDAARYRMERHQIERMLAGLRLIEETAAVHHADLIRVLDGVAAEGLPGIRDAVAAAYASIRGLLGDCPCRGGQDEQADAAPLVDIYCQAVERLAPAFDKMAPSVQGQFACALTKMFEGEKV